MVEFPHRRILLLLPEHEAAWKQLASMKDQCAALNVHLVVLRLAHNEHIYVFDVDKLESGQGQSITEALNFDEEPLTWKPRQLDAATTRP